MKIVMEKKRGLIVNNSTKDRSRRRKDFVWGVDEILRGSNSKANFGISLVANLCFTLNFIYLRFSKLYYKLL